MDNRFGDTTEWQFANGVVPPTSIGHHEVDSAVACLAEPACQLRTVGQGQLDLAAAGPTEVLLRGERPVHTRRGHLEDIRRIGFQGVRGVEQFGCGSRQRGDRIEIETFVTVGYHRDARRTCTGVDDDVLDFVPCARELAVE